MTSLRPLRLLPEEEARHLGRLIFNYAEVGATRQSQLPAGCHAWHHRVAVGTGWPRYEQLASALLSWGLHRRAGLEMQVSDERVEPGVVSVAGLRIGPVLITAPCRVIYTIQEARRVAFAYGTLPGHPLAGEERFEISIDDNERICFDLRLFSRPSTAVARFGGPITTAFQSLVNRRYFVAVRRL